MSFLTEKKTILFIPLNLYWEIVKLIKHAWYLIQGKLHLFEQFSLSFDYVCMSVNR